MEKIETIRPRRRFFGDMFEMLVLVTVAFLVGLIINQFRDKPLALVYESKKQRIDRAVAQVVAEVPKPTGETSAMLSSESLTAEQVQDFIKQNRGIVFDARPEIFHRLGHLPGALSLPREDFENAYKVFQSKLEANRGQSVVLYCSSSSCEDAGLVAKALRSLGYTNVAIFTGGWAEWQDKGFPTEEQQ